VDVRTGLTASLALLCLPGALLAEWEPTAGPGHAAPRTVFTAGGRLLVGVSRHGVFVSDDQGTSWEAAAGIEGASVTCFASNASYVFAGLDNLGGGPGGVYRSADGGSTWEPAISGLGSRTILSLLAVGSTIYAGDLSTGVYRSLNDGESWSPANNGIATETIRAIVRSGPTLFAAGTNNLYRSTDGQNWGFTDGGQYFPIAGMAAFGPLILAGGFQGLIRSTDGGQTWSERIDVLFTQSLDRLTSFAADGADLYASTISSPGSGGSGVIRSADGGLAWEPANAGIERVGVETVVFDGTRLVGAAPDKGVLLSEDGGGSWTRSVQGIPFGGNIRALANTSSFLFAATQGDGVYRSEDNGENWTQTSQDPSHVLENETVISLLAEDAFVLAGTAFSGVFRSADGGATWISSNAGLPAGVVQGLSLARAGTNVLLGTQDALYYSSNGGVSWNPSTLGDGAVSALAADDGFAHANYVNGISSIDGIYRSTNDGVSWTLVFQSLSTPYIASMRADGAFVYAGIFIGGMLRSTDHGSSWQDASPPGGVPVYSVHVAGTDLFAGSDPSGAMVYRSSDHGGTWEPYGDGLPSGEAVEAIGGGMPYLFAGTEDEGVWRKLQEVTAVDPSRRDAPGVRVLAAPNPVRAWASIHFELPHAAIVDIRVLDASGRLVADLVRGFYGAGGHDVSWDARGVPSGIYFVRMETPGRCRTARAAVVR
jgi:photosystem II stability/assembly factor-like uncharacterized protein